MVDLELRRWRGCVDHRQVKAGATFRCDFVTVFRRSRVKGNRRLALCVRTQLLAALVNRPSIRTLNLVDGKLPRLFSALLMIIALVSTGATASSVSTAVANAQSVSACGLSDPAFCDTFDTPAGTGNRSGQLNGTVWGVSRLSGDDNFGNPADGWGQSQQTLCGTTQAVTPDNDIFLCNGLLVEGQDDNEGVTTIAMYPKQPFDFAGRTGKVTRSEERRVGK